MRALLAATGLLLTSSVLAGPPILLDWGAIETSSPIQQRQSRALAAAAAPSALQRLSARGTAPWLIQFDDVIGQETRTAVEATGARIKGYIPENALLVEAAATQAAAIGSWTNVTWVGEYRSEYKRARPVREMIDKGTETTRDYSILLFQAGDIAPVTLEVQSLGAVVLSSAETADGGLVRARLTLAQLQTVSGWGEVQWIEPYTRPRPLNNVAVGGTMMNVSNAWTTLGLTGAGQTIAVADTGLDSGNTNTIHPDFAGRVTGFAWSNGATSTSYSWADTDAHGTHVSGSVLGNGTMSTGRYKGVAYEARLIIQGTQNDLSGLPTSLATLFNQAFTNGARIHSDSWGYDDFGYYNTDSRAVDQYVWSNRTMLIVIAAGNSGTDSNNLDGIIDPMSVASPATAKNCLTVGAAENFRTSGGYSSAYTWGTAWPGDYPVSPIYGDYISRPASNSIQGLAAFSSRGPCNDGRIKPDIVAPGTDIISTRSRRASGTGWGTVSDNTNYIFEGGTSMATPLTAGAAGLARQWLITSGGITNPSASLLKALLLNGARNMAPGQYGTGTKQEIPNARPNNAEGWGHIDLFNTLRPGTNYTLSLYDTNSLSTGGTNFFPLAIYAATTNRCTMTLAYADYWGTAGSGKQLVNDLDLTVQKPSGAFLYANGRTSVDATNNVETVEFTPDEVGTYAIRVAGRSVPSGGAQPYALVVLSPNTTPPDSAPVFVPLGIQTAISAVATSFVVSVGGYPVPTLQLTATTASTGYSFNAVSGQLIYTPPFEDVGNQSFIFTASNALGVASQTVDVSVALSSPASPAAIWAGETNAYDVTAAWAPSAGAASYLLDVHTSAAFAPSFPASQGLEGFTNIGASSSTYATRLWTNAGVVWAAYKARTDYTINGQAIGLQNAAGAYFVSGSLTGGVSELSIVHRRSTGSAATFDIFVNTTKVASAVSMSTLVATTKVTGINVSGNFTIMVTNSGANVARFDTLVWTNAGAAGGSFVPGYSNRPVESTSQIVTGLAPGATYFMRVRATNASGISAYSPVTNVTTVTAVADVAPSFGAVAPFAATVGVATAFSVSAGGTPAPVVSLASSTATTGYSFNALSGLLSYTPPAGDVGARTFTFLATNRAGSATQVVTGTVFPAPAYVPVVSTTNVATDGFTALWTAVTDATNYQVQVGSDTNFSTSVPGGDITVLTNAATNAVAPSGWSYNISASSVSYLILGYSTNYVQTPVFSTVGLSSLATDLKARTYGGVNAMTNTVTVSISTNGGGTWIDIGTVVPLNTTLTSYGAIDASPYVGSSNVCLRWEARAAGGNRGAGIQAISVTGTEIGDVGSLLVDQVTTARTLAVSGLLMQTMYYVRARADAGTWSDAASVMTLGPEPAAPVFVAGAGPYATTAGLELVFDELAQGNPEPVVILDQTTATPGNYSFNAGTLTYQPAMSEAGPQSFLFLATNAVGVATQVVSVSVAQATPPAFGSLGSLVATTRVAMSFVVAPTSGIPTPALSLVGTTASGGYSFTPDSGRLRYTAPTNDVGLRSFTFSGSNVAGVATQVIQVSVVAAPATPPTIDSIPPQSTLAGAILHYAVTASDPDSAQVTFACTSAVPSGLWSLNTNTGAFAFSPTTNQIGTNIFTLRATDDGLLQSAPSNLVVLVNSAADQVPVSFGMSRIVTEEGAGTAVIPVTLSYTGTAAVQVRFMGPTNGAAQWGSDFNCSTTLVISGSSSGQVVVSIADDALPEGAESVRLALVPVPPATAGVITQAVLHIRDNDALSILAGNLTSGNDQTYQEAGSRILEALSPDVALLQEFTPTNGVTTNAYRAWVNQRFGTNFSYFVESEASDNIPNGIVSRWPILESGEWTDTQISDRDFVWASIDLPGTQVLHVVSIHLKASSGYESTRTAQARAITNNITLRGWLTNGYVVIGGDLNLGSRTETALAVLTNKVVTDKHQPADQNGNKNTNSGRDNPYDLVLPGTNLDARARAINLFGYSFPNGVVFDTRVAWTNGAPPPALATDSADTNMQHMAVMKLFEMPDWPHDAVVDPPASFAATSTSYSAVTVSFATNAAGDEVVIVGNGTGSFTSPAGALPAPGSSFAGGTLLYQGTASPFVETGLIACAVRYYKAWSVSGTNYSASGLAASAATPPPAAPVFTSLTALGSDGFAAAWNASPGAADYRFDLWTGAAPPPSGQYVAGYSNLIVSGTGLSVTGLAGGLSYNMRVRAAAATCESASSTATSLFIKATQFITFAAIPDQLTTNHVALAAHASSALPISYLVTGPASASAGSNLTFTGTGAVRVVASQAGNTNFLAASDVTNQFNVSKAQAAVSLLGLMQSYNGAAHAVTAATAPTGLVVAITYNGGVQPPTAVGIYSLTGTVVNAMFDGSATGMLVISQGSAAVYLSALSAAYDGFPKSAIATTDPSGLAVVIEYNGAAGAPVNAGDYAVVATIEDSNYFGAATGILSIARATQSIHVVAIADQMATSVVSLAASADSGLPVDFAVNGPGALAQSNLSFTATGLVAVTASQSGNSNWLAAAAVTSTFNVVSAQGTVLLAGLHQTYDGSNKTVSVTTDPTSLVVDITYDATPLNAGEYGIRAAIVDPLFAGEATGTLIIARAPQAVSFSPIMDQLATNEVILQASASSGLDVVFSVAAGLVTLTGSNSVVFTGSGEVQLVAAQAGDTNWLAAIPVTNAFHVAKADAAIFLSDFNQVYDGGAKSITASTDPAGLAVAITFDGTPVNAGSYAVTATIDDGVFQGSATGLLSIAKASTFIAWSEPASIVYGTLLGTQQLGAVASTAGAITFAPAEGALLNAGTNFLGASFVPDDAANYEGCATGVLLVVERAPQSIVFPNPGSQLVSNEVHLSATAGSGLPATFAVAQGPATLTGASELTFSSAGLVGVVASQEGDTNWLAAIPVTNLFTVAWFEDANTNDVPDDWEVLHFGSVNVMTGTSDQDLDGQSDVAEFIAATDPTNRLSYSRVEIIPAPGAGRIVYFLSASGRVYQVDATDQMNFPDWQPLFTNVAGSGLPIELTDTNAPGLRFYRHAVRLVPPASN